MKPTLALKPLVFALAAVMAVAAQAGDRGGNHGGNTGGNNNNDTLLQLLVNSGAGATVTDTQNNGDNAALNQGTRNDARMESSANNSQGNLGANTAGGSGNQQDNVAAIATADENFIFGSAVAISTATQLNSGNHVVNHASSNSAGLSNSANGSSGNIGVNVSAGDFNQQKNNLAIAVSGGRVAVAAAGANQTVQGLTVENRADRSKEVTTLTTKTTGSGTYKGTATGYAGEGYHKTPVSLKEQGTIDLAGSSSYQVLTPTGWRNPVTNTASMNNSLNGVSGNVGANVSAGVGNQQSNSLSIAAGCKACM